MTTETKPPPPAQSAPVDRPTSHADAARPHRRGYLKWVAIVIVLGLALGFGIPWVRHALVTVSTDDAYVNGHVTLVAARVPGLSRAASPSIIPLPEVAGARSLLEVAMRINSALRIHR